MVHLFLKYTVCQQTALWPPLAKKSWHRAFILFRTLSFRVMCPFEIFCTALQAPVTGTPGGASLAGGGGLLFCKHMPLTPERQLLYYDHLLFTKHCRCTWHFMRHKDKVPAPCTETLYPASHLSELSCGEARRAELKSREQCLKHQGGRTDS